MLATFLEAGRRTRIVEGGMRRRKQTHGQPSTQPCLTKPARNAPVPHITGLSDRDNDEPDRSTGATHEELRSTNCNTSRAVNLTRAWWFYPNLIDTTRQNKTSTKDNTNRLIVMSYLHT